MLRIVSYTSGGSYNSTTQTGDMVFVIGNVSGTVDSGKVLNIVPHSSVACGLRMDSVNNTFSGSLTVTNNVSCAAITTTNITCTNLTSFINTSILNQCTNYSSSLVSFINTSIVNSQTNFTSVTNLSSVNCSFAFVNISTSTRRNENIINVCATNSSFQNISVSYLILDNSTVNSGLLCQSSTSTNMLK